MVRLDLGGEADYHVGRENFVMKPRPTLDQWLEERRNDWDRLTQILDLIRASGMSSVTQSELDELGRLYRKATSDLAYAQSHFRDPDTLWYLNRLVARAHSNIYIGSPARMKKVGRFFSRDFPRTFRSAGAFIAVACLVMILAMFAGYALGAWSPATVEAMVSEKMREGIKEMGQCHQQGCEIPVEIRSTLASIIMVNNIQVGFISFALGIGLGVGTVIVLAYNGLFLGILAAYTIRYGVGLLFWSLVVAHGVIELPAIFICGGGGLLLGYALINPGDHTRKDALVLNGRQAVRLILGTLPLFALAALIEAFITPTNLSPAFKTAFAGLMIVGLGLYLFGAGRDSKVE